MELNNLEIGKNFQTININDLKAIDKSNINDRNQKLKIDIHLTNLAMLEEFENSDLLSVPNIHIRLSFTKQIFLILNSTDVLKKAIIKSVSVDDTIITLELYTVNKVSQFIYQNNIKVLERLNYISNDIQIHSKNHEILYHANLILKELYKSDNKMKDIKNRINKLNEYMNS